MGVGVLGPHLALLHRHCWGGPAVRRNQLPRWSCCTPPSETSWFYQLIDETVHWTHHQHPDLTKESSTLTVSGKRKVSRMFDFLSALHHNQSRSPEACWLEGKPSTGVWAWETVPSEHLMAGKDVVQQTLGSREPQSSWGARTTEDSLLGDQSPALQPAFHSRTHLSG